MYRFTGLYCPGCGATRALFLLSHGHPLSAAAMNPLLALAVIFTATLLFKRAPKFHNLHGWKSQTVAWIAVAIVVLFTVARNLPWEPFCLLAPGAMLGH